MTSLTALLLATAAAAADPLAAPRGKVLETIASHRMALLPKDEPPAQVTVRFGPRLEHIRAAALAAKTRAELSKVELDFVDWHRAVMSHLHAEAVLAAAGAGREAPAEEAYRAERMKEVAAVAAVRQLAVRRGLDPEANNLAALSATADPAAMTRFFDGASASGGADGAVRADAPAFDDPARYAKIRSLLVAQGASPRVVDAAIAEGIRQKVDPALVLSVIWKESGFRPGAHNKGSDARGLMQLLPDTAADMGVRGSLFDIGNNLRAGVRYLKWIANDYFKMGADLTDVSQLGEGRLKTILASYNAGIGRVRQWLKRQGENLPHIPYAETRDYVLKIKDKIADWLGWN